MKIKNQTIYIAYIEQFLSNYKIDAHVIKGTAKNIHDEFFPIWTEIKYINEMHDNYGSFDGYHINLGPCYETCLIFTNKEEAIKRLFVDIYCFLKFSRRMNLYDIIRPQIFDEDIDINIVYHENNKTETIKDDDIIKLLTKEEKDFLFDKDPLEQLEDIDYENDF